MLLCKVAARLKGSERMCVLKAWSRSFLPPVFHNGAASELGLS